MKWSKRKIVCFVAVFLVLNVMRVTLPAVLEDPAWRHYQAQQELGSGGVGSQAEPGVTPIVSSLEDLEQAERFVWRGETDPTQERFRLGEELYCVLTLESGQRIAAAIWVGSCIREDDVWYSPVGRWEPWELTEAERAELEEHDLSTTDYYADMIGNHGTALSQSDYQTRVWNFCSLSLLICGVLVLLGFGLSSRLGGSSRPKNDVELWIAGTHALWGQQFAVDIRAVQKGVTQPVRLGGLPKNQPVQKAVQKALEEEWRIRAYPELLEAVAHMSRGDGFTNCTSQAARAWQLCRCTALLGMAYLLDWDTREEIVRRACEVGQIMQKTFDSWEELCQGYLEQYAQMTLADAHATEREAQAAVQAQVDLYWELKRRKGSPYRLPWQLDLAPEK